MESGSYSVDLSNTTIAWNFLSTETFNLGSFNGDVFSDENGTIASFIGFTLTTNMVGLDRGTSTSTPTRSS